MLTFPVLVLCGVLAVFCRAVAYEAGDWIAMSLAFLPILLSSAVLLALGVLLIRIHIHEVKSLHLGFRRLIPESSVARCRSLAGMEKCPSVLHFNPRFT